ncbi:cytochrome P450 [Gigaspora margarita]|uniref:Cytochrome P450 n=1 Tax=Gigaspora margarita TaxID=4874 RepID=A0A8H4EMN8_GIGMA|nr:cytochrome P450 [Gigaspora margarita]
MVTSKTLCQKYGDICEFRLGGYGRILLSKADYFESLLISSRNLSVSMNSEYSPVMNTLKNFGRGIILNNNYESWKINKYFLVQSLSTPGFNEEAIKHTNELFEKLDEYWIHLKNLNYAIMIGLKWTFYHG